MDLPTAVAAVVARRRPPVGRPAIVRAVATAGLTVELDGTDLVLPFTTGSYAVGDSVLVTDLVVVARLGTPATVPAPLVVDPPPTAREAVVLPLSTGTWRGDRWLDTTTVAQGDDGTGRVASGGVFYGDQLTALGADLAAPRSAVLTYRRHIGPANVPSFGLLTERTRPATAPSPVAATSGPAPAPLGEPTTWALPAAWLDELLAGARGGLALAGTAHLVLAGLGESSDAWALTVTYHHAATI